MPWEPSSSPRSAACSSRPSPRSPEREPRGLTARLDHPDVLWVYAAPKEGAAVAGALGRSCALGVGKTPAATRLTAALIERRPALVVAFGVCGAYREDPNAPAVGEGCLVGSERWGDEGVLTPSGFLDLVALGLAPAEPLVASGPHVQALAGALGLPVLVGATVSTCSGTDAGSEAVQRRTGAQIETMEGAAIAWVCRTHGVPWVGLRVVSNRTGDRDHAGWDLELALARLADWVARAAAVDLVLEA